MLAALALCGCLTKYLPAEETSPAPSSPQPSQPIPWNQRTLFIPYQLNQESPALQQIAKVQLLISRTGASDWIVLQVAEPNVQGFRYHAPEDGDYWFALRHLDAKGEVLDGPVIAPQLHLVINTQSVPAFKAPTNPPAITEPTTIASAGSESMAGTRSFAATNPFEAAATPAQEWPANNQLPPANQLTTPASATPPANNSYTSVADTHVRRTPAKFAVDGTGDSKGQEQESEGFTTNLLDGKANSVEQPAQLPPVTESEWSSAGPQSGPMLVNVRTFDVEYDLQAVGAWGIAKVELWGTRDEGATWQSFGVDPDNRSPMRVTVPGSGTFGFRIVVEGANSIGVRPPQTGDKPELVTVVDLDPPKAEITAVETGAGNLADQLRIRWSAEDKNLELRPIGLFYSSYAEGPWSTIATGLENTGSYEWRIERHTPGRFFLKLEARDTAGNLTTYQSPHPIEINQPQPTGTLRSIRPVTDGPAVKSQ